MELTKLLNGQMSEIGNNFETKHFEGEITKLKRWIGIDNHSRLHNWTRISTFGCNIGNQRDTTRKQHQH